MSDSGEPVKIRCGNLRDGRRCGRFLAELSGDKIRFYCPQCREFHEENAEIVIQELESYLGELRERVRRKARIGFV